MSSTIFIDKLILYQNENKLVVDVRTAPKIIIFFRKTKIWDSVIEEVEDAAVAEEEAVAAAEDSKDTKIRDPQRAFSNSDMFLTLAR